MRFLNDLLDLIFPKFCLGCQAEGEWICAKCKQSVPVLVKYYCPSCKQESNDGATCDECRNALKLDGLLVAVDYENKLISRAVHYFKYQYITEVSDYLVDLMAEFWRKNNLSKKFGDYIIIPVPLHHRRYLSRGYNQAEILSKILAERIKLEERTNILFRKKYTAQQMHLDREERLKNVVGAFSVRDGENYLRGKNILLIDDVSTTSKTLDECADVLKKAGAKSVWGFVVARNLAD